MKQHHPRDLLDELSKCEKEVAAGKANLSAPRKPSERGKKPEDKLGEEPDSDIGDDVFGDAVGAHHVDEDVLEWEAELFAADEICDGGDDTDIDCEKDLTGNFSHSVFSALSRVVLRRRCFHRLICVGNSPRVSLFHCLTGCVLQSDRMFLCDHAC